VVIFIAGSLGCFDLWPVALVCVRQRINKKARGLCLRAAICDLLFADSIRLMNLLTLVPCLSNTNTAEREMGEEQIGRKLLQMCQSANNPRREALTAILLRTFSHWRRIEKEEENK
jgi:hypothetical protein